MGVDFVNIKEIFRQVHGYLGGVTNLVDQTHCCTTVNPKPNPKPFQPIKMGRGEVGSEICKD